ncbi:TraR/DksA C4-type zinc finger protein [Asticcacaulis sp. YBE204]|uniref:TraR/DksA C4-type zinc finger protein n=1 Tax=Asticcacaulis sp. YBE204 TaxID=1282363 RepID=UPI0003C3BCF0|nr:TraR/DksA C4-type zinc finger protein [Asticcacaulis sp. YBE204]ESQ78497.1 hypothetical protein AEYBE204_13160 [Asticcacaulis sp. YBE204]
MADIDDMDAAQAKGEQLNSEAVAAQLAGIRVAAAMPGTDDCVGCGSEIEEARRRAQPSARRCLICQQAAERRGHLGRGA